MDESTIRALKDEYNQYLLRAVKAEIYLDNEAIPRAEREKHIPAFLAIIKRLNGILQELKQTGIKYTDQEILGGFANE